MKVNGKCRNTTEIEGVIIESKSLSDHISNTGGKLLNRKYNPRWAQEFFFVDKQMKSKLSGIIAEAERRAEAEKLALQAIAEMEKEMRQNG